MLLHWRDVLHCRAIPAAHCSPCAEWGEETTSRANPLEANSTGFRARHSMTPQMCSPATRGLALAAGIPDKVGQEDEEEQAAITGIISPWASRNS